MTQAKHTPGPWGCVDTSNHAHDYRLTQADGYPLPLKVEANDHSEQRANARLIAAAPDLLAALTAIIGDQPEDKYGYFAAHNAMDEDKRQAARAAISKATNT